MLSELLSQDTNLFEDNGLNQKLLQKIDEILIKHESEISTDVVGIYKKFLPMKQNAPVEMKNNLFNTILNFAKEKTQQKSFAEALLMYRFLIIKSVISAQTMIDIAEVTANFNEIVTAVNFAGLYESRESDSPLKFLSLANFYNLTLKDYKSAVNYYEKYLHFDDKKSVIYTILANLYAKVYSDSSLEKQIYYFEKAYELKPDDRLILHGLAFCYEKFGNRKKADIYYQKLLQNNPTETDFYNYGAFLIQSGDFKNGHRYFSHRFNTGDANLKYPINDLERKWDFKQNLSGKTLLIHYEQGFGDTFMYCRFVPLMKKFAGKIIFLVQDDLFEIIKNSPLISAGIDVVSDKTDLSALNYDCHMALLDCPYALGTIADEMPFTRAYLTVPQAQVNNYREKYINNNRNLKVGICTNGDKNANYNGRDIEFSAFKSIFNIEGVEFYSFSKDFETEGKIINLGGTFSNFTDTACALKCMDFVISTDNVILNLSGALGIETYGLFNKYPNFRWYKLSTDNVGWYESVKPLQVSENNCWKPILNEIEQIIRQKSAQN